MNLVEFSRITAVIAKRAAGWSHENVILISAKGADAHVSQEVLDRFSDDINELLDDLRPSVTCAICANEQQAAREELTRQAQELDMGYGQEPDSK